MLFRKTRTEIRAANILHARLAHRVERWAIMIAVAFALNLALTTALAIVVLV